MSDKLYTLTEEQALGLFKKGRSFGYAEIHGEDSRDVLTAFTNDVLPTLPVASVPVVPSDPLYGVSCEHMGNGSARWSMSQQKENELRELLYSTPSPSDPLREVVATVIMDSAGGDYSADYKDIEIHHDVLDRLPVATKLYAAPEPHHD